jgi:hypothetical protein
MSCCQPGLFPQASGMTSALSSLVSPVMAMTSPRRAADMLPGAYVSSSAQVTACGQARLTSLTTSAPIPR